MLDKKEINTRKVHTEKQSSQCSWFLTPKPYIWQKMRSMDFRSSQQWQRKMSSRPKEANFQLKRLDAQIDRQIWIDSR